MLMITALIQPFRLDHVRSELVSADLIGLTISHCYGNGREPKFVPSLTGGPDVPDILPKVKIEIAIPSDKRDEAIAAIIRGARLGKIGDGKIFVSPLDRVISVRTGSENEDALQSLHWPAEAAE
jgi:nitrogen regulatory protein P-II 1